MLFVNLQFCYLNIRNKFAVLLLKYLLQFNIFDFLYYFPQNPDKED
jgi:hypothetical protein